MTQTVCNDCVKGTYSNVTASGTCTVCRDGSTTTGTKSSSCNATCSNNNTNVLSWVEPVWNSSNNTLANECKISECKTGYDGQLSANKCVANSYKISFTMNGGKLNGNASPSVMNATYDVTVNIPNPTRAGYEFTGWTFDGNTTTAYHGSTLWSSTSTKAKDTTFKNLTATHNGTVTLTANWSACPAGKYQDGSGSTCLNCPLNTYNPNTASNSCTNCPGEMSAPVGSTAKTNCSITCASGTYLIKNQAACTTCPAGKYCQGGTFNFNETTDQIIESCPGTLTSNTGSSLITHCKITCAAGYYLTAGSSSCTICPQNNYCGGNTYNYNPTNNQGIAGCPSAYPNTESTGTALRTQCRSTGQCSRTDCNHTGCTADGRYSTTEQCNKNNCESHSSCSCTYVSDPSCPVDYYECGGMCAASGKFIKETHGTSCDTCEWMVGQQCTSNIEISCSGVFKKCKISGASGTYSQSHDCTKSTASSYSSCTCSGTYYTYSPN